MNESDTPSSLPFYMPEGADPKAIEGLIRANPKLNALVQERKTLEQKIQSVSGQARQNLVPSHQDARYRVDSGAERTAAARKWADKREALRLRKLAQSKSEMKAPKPRLSPPERPLPRKRAVEDFVPQAERYAPKTADAVKRAKSARTPDWAAERDRLRDDIRQQGPREDLKRTSRTLTSAETMFTSDAEFDYDKTGLMRPRTELSLDTLNCPTSKPAVQQRPAPKSTPQAKPRRLVKELTKKASTKRIKSDVSEKRKQRTDDAAAFYKKRDDAATIRPKIPKDMIDDRLDSLRNKALVRKKKLKESDPPLNRRSDKIDRFRDRWF